MLIYPTFKMAPIQGLTGFGGGATGYLVGGGVALPHPFDDMSNFTGATKASENVIYYTTTGTTYSFTDPNGGASKFRFTVVGGGGATSGDGHGGWYGVTGGGGGGAARGEIQTSQTLGINVAQGGGSPGYFGYGSNYSSTWLGSSISGSANNTNRVYGRGGLSYVQAAPNPSGHWLLYGYGGLPGIYRYPNSTNDLPGSGYTSSFNGNRSYWLNGGKAVVSSGGGVTVTNGSTEFGGTGGCSGHKSSPASPIHPYDGYNTTPSANEWTATVGQSTTYAGPGGGGGCDGGIATYAGVAAAGAAGGTASGLNTLLSGSGLTSKGGNGTSYNSRGNPSTRGTLGGGCGGNAADTSDTWNDNFTAASGIVIVEFLGF